VDRCAGTGRDPDAEGHPEVQLADGADDPLAHLDGVLGVGILEQRAELVAAGTGEQVAVADVAGERAGNGSDTLPQESPDEPDHVASTGYGNRVTAVMRLHVGCAMWTHKAWQERFLAHPAQERLRAYARWCNAVEGNTTFYATPSRETVASWAQQTDPDFRFVLKLPRSVTHERRLIDVDAELRAFLAAVEPLGPRAHALWIQLPASFSPSEVPALAGFLRRLPRSHRYAVEVRHRAFFEEPSVLEGVLAEVGAEWIPFDTTTFFQRLPTSPAERDAWTKKPRLPLRSVALTDRPIVRYLGRDDSAVTIEGWQRWVGVVAGWLREGRSPTVFIHTPDNADAPGLARRFHDQVRARLPELEALPEPDPVTPLTLF
jgi:uncharacterized protein YecE (DUF72 family)